MKIALSGNSGSGKSWIARYLVERHGFVHASTGNICRQISTVLFGNEDKSSLNRVSEAIRGIDKTLLIRAALRNAQGDAIVFDSLRYQTDLPVLKAEGFRNWRIHCPIDECVRRLVARGQSITEADLAHPSEMELSNAAFDAVLVNHERPRSELEGEIDSLLRS